MSKFCSPPQESDNCLKEEDLLKIASKQAMLEASYREFNNLLKHQEGVNNEYIDIAAEYLKMIQAAAINVDKNSIHSASSALQSLKLFNNNYKLLRDSFNNFYDFIKRLGIDLTYKLIDINADYNLSNADLTGNIIFRITNSTANFILDELGDSTKYVGKIIHIRNCTQDIITINTSGNVSIKPEDAAYLRREGSTIGLIYVGDNKWDIYGELP